MIEDIEKLILSFVARCTLCRRPCIDFTDFGINRACEGCIRQAGKFVLAGRFSIKYSFY